MHLNWQFDSVHVKCDVKTGPKAYAENIQHFISQRTSLVNDKTINRFKC